ncbi:MAG: hypothetical protein NC092_05420 [Butyrivibrio sp.]|nr:hypothetical protein [Butyrivibrio sp.]
MKTKLTLLAMAMLLVLAACGNKTDALTGTSAPASAGTAENASKESEKETGAVESIVEDVVEVIDEAAKPQPGDVTNKMYFTEDIFFTSSTSLEFDEGVEYGSSTSTGYFWIDEDHNAEVSFSRGDGFIAPLFDPLNASEGSYQGTMGYEGDIELHFVTEGKDGEIYEIMVGSHSDVATYKPDEKYVELFLQLVEDFLNSGITAESKMSDIQYDTAVLSETNTANFFTSPDAIAAE